MRALKLRCTGRDPTPVREQDEANRGTSWDTCTATIMRMVIPMHPDTDTGTSMRLPISAGPLPSAWCSTLHL